MVLSLQTIFVIFSLTTLIDGHSVERCSNKLLLHLVLLDLPSIPIEMTLTVKLKNVANLR